MLLAGPIELSEDELTAIFVVLAVAAVTWTLIVAAATWWGAQIGHDLAGHRSPRRHSRVATTFAWLGATTSPIWLAGTLPIRGLGLPFTGVVLAVAAGAAVGALGSGSSDDADHA